jgi:uncharacterized protein YutE (UPF0331/DUF86 family)
VTSSKLRSHVVPERAAWIDCMLRAMRALPTASLDRFRADPHAAAAAESYLRRALEALLDLRRHVPAKGLGQGVAEYKEIAAALRTAGVLDAEAAGLLREMAGYRNRIVHFHHDIGSEELLEIRTRRLGDSEAVRDRILSWLREHPDLLDPSLQAGRSRLSDVVRGSQSPSSYSPARWVFRYIPSMRSR